MEQDIKEAMTAAISSFFRRTLREDLYGQDSEGEDQETIEEVSEEAGGKDQRRE